MSKKTFGKREVGTPEPDRHVIRLGIPCATVFIASFCIMVLEISATRLIARYLGVSLYTWTSVIGVVLAGLTLGSYFGGRVADRFPPAKVLFTLFLFSSLSCATAPVLNYVMGNHLILLFLPWSVRIMIHVAVIFLLPSTILGAIGPVVAKFALDQGFRTGRTLGDIYAWGAFGSIMGTFLTGFLLVPLLGTIAIIWTVAAVLAMVSILYGLYTKKALLSYMWIALLIPLIFISCGSPAWAKTVGGRLFLREVREPWIRVVYCKDSQYSCIRVEEEKDVSDIRYLILDDLVHNKVSISDPADIQHPNQYPYLKVYEFLSRHLFPLPCVGEGGVGGYKDKPPSFLVIGGGAYVFPRYLERFYPGSHIEVVEIDPAVTRTAIQFFSLPERNSFQIHHLDARNYVDNLLKKRPQGEDVKFDFIYADTFNDVAVPFQLTTYEFNEKVRQILSPEGIYMFHMVDVFHSGQFLGAVLNTLQKTFPYVYVFSAGRLNDRPDTRNTFVIVSSSRPLNIPEFSSTEIARSSLLDEAQIRYLKERSRGTILTDDYVPVENLLKPVIKAKVLNTLCKRLAERGDEFASHDNFNKAMEYYKKSVYLDPDYSQGWFNAGSVLANQGKFPEAIEYYQKVLKIDPEFSLAYYSLGNIFSFQGRTQEAIAQYRQALKINPGLLEARDNLDLALSRGRIHPTRKQ
ncbi:MAG: fused MFS/spermidine synthase [Candidatus Omnitrophota bacterium]